MKFFRFFFVVASCLVLASHVHAATIALNPTSGFLRTENDPGATPAPAIELSALGISAGDQIRLESVGSYDRGGGFGEFFDLIGVFSSSNTLLAGNFLNRVSGAIDFGTDVFTIPTNFGGSPTDISEDFLISASDGSVRSIVLTVPDDALFLFLGTADSYYEDNVTIGEWAVNIDKANVVPLPPALPSMMLGLLGIVMLRRARNLG